MTPTDRLAHALPKDPAKDSLEQAEIRAALAAAGLDHDHPVSEWTRRNEDADPDGGA